MVICFCYLALKATRAQTQHVNEMQKFFDENTQTVMFGKHKGKPLSELIKDRSYVMWLVDTAMKSGGVMQEFYERFVRPEINKILRSVTRATLPRTIKIGSQTFAGLEEAKSYLQNLFVSVGPTGSLKETNPQVFLKFVEVLQLHPEKERKRINDAVDIKIIKGYREGIWHIKLVFEDDTEDSVSYMSCLTGKIKNSTIPQKLNEALRNAVQPQIQEFKQSHPEKKCELCGTLEAQDYHVDHVKLFCTLTEEFLSFQSDIPETFGKQADSLGVMRTCFWDRHQAFSEEWQAYHKQHATLRWLCSMCNLTREKKI